MSLVINPLRASYKEDPSAMTFLEDWAERVNVLDGINEIESEWEKEREFKKANEVDNFKVSEDLLLQRTLEDIERQNKWTLEAAKREKEYFLKRAENTGEITDELAAISKEYLIRNCIALKKKILFCYTIKQKIMVTCINTFSGFSERLLDPNNKKKVYKVNFFVYSAKEILDIVIEYLKKIDTMSAETYEERRARDAIYEEALFKIRKMYNQFNDICGKEDERFGGLEGDRCCCECDCAPIAYSSSRINSAVTEVKNSKDEKYRYIPFDIFKDKLTSLSSSVTKIINLIVEKIKDCQKGLIEIIKKIDKIQGKVAEGKAAIKKINELNATMEILTTRYLRDLNSLLNRFFDSLNRIDIIAKGK